MAAGRHIAAVAALVGVLVAPLRAAAPAPTLPEGMDAETVRAVERGLEYLARTQRQDGCWFNAGGYGIYPTVMTSLAGLAFMGEGSTPHSGTYSRNVSKAMAYVLRVAEANDDGLIAGQGAESRSMYGHGFGMLFLAQCYGVESEKEYEQRLRAVLDKAVELTARSQSDLGKGLNHAGGWIYTPNGRSDEGSVTVTQLQALRACRNAGIKVPKSTIDRAVAYLRHCQNPDGGICYSASSRGESRPPISAAAVACFYSAGVYDRATGGAGSEAEMVEKLVAYCRRNIHTDNNMGHWYYMHLYMAQAMYQRGGNEWQDYYAKIKKRLLETQAPDGSWSGDGVGTCYGTALATIILQLPYGYLPICQR